MITQNLVIYPALNPVRTCGKYSNYKARQECFTGHFDVASGLWKYPALSSHKPKEMQDPDIVNCTQEHNDYISSYKLDHDTGLCTGYILKSSPFDPTGQPKSCNCGNTYSEEGAYV